MFHDFSWEAIFLFNVICDLFSSLNIFNGISSIVCPTVGDYFFFFFRLQVEIVVEI